MQLSVAARSSRNGSNGNGRIHGATQVVKRNGGQVPYDKEKIFSAVFRCLNTSCNLPDNGPTRQAAQTVADQVDRLLPFEVKQPVTVERVQDLVEQQLMANGFHEAAKHYILYREQHRKLRTERPVSPEIAKAFADARKHFNGPNADVQLFQAYSKFARFNREKGRRETWPETVRRVMDYTKQHMDAKHPCALDEEDYVCLEESLLQLESSPSMRLIQMAGPSLDRCQTGVYNCSFQFLRSPTDMAEELYLLMQGCGVGFSVEYENSVDHWPRVKRQTGVKLPTHVIPDSTEGWCDAYRIGLETWLDGNDIDFDFSKIRGKGTVLKTKGGRASGPQPLKDLLAFTRQRILQRQNQRLSSLDLHDINCYAHRIVQMGGVRRASGISLSDLIDGEMQNAKSGEFWNTNPQRNQANNSAVYEEKPSIIEFMQEWLSLAKSGTGERGIFNRGALGQQMPARRDNGHVFGVNPCGEIILRNKQFCNLSIAVIRPTDSWPVIRKKVLLATMWGTIQSTMTNFSYVCGLWKENCEEERLLGVDLLGHLDHPLFRPGSEGLDVRLQELRDLAVGENARLANVFGIPASAAVTCGKPSGDSSQFYDTAAGFKPHHGEYYVRRFRVDSTDPVGLMLKDHGVPCFEDYDNAGLMVLEFPIKSPEGAILLGDQTAIEQLEHWKAFKVNFTEHNPSVTIYVQEHEWLLVGQWVYSHWENVGGLSFMPHFGGVYPLAPYEAIDKAEYDKRKSEFPKIDWSKLMRYENEDKTTGAQTYACTSDSCSL